MEETIFEYQEEDPFKGILSYLAKEAPESFKCAASSTYDGYTNSLFSQQSTLTKWESKSNDKQPFVQFDFGTKRVAVLGYSLRSGDNQTDDRHPSCWFIAGSNDQENWSILDEQNDTHVLHGASFVSTNACSEGEAEEPFRYIRIQMPEPNFRGDWTFRLSRVEFYGKLVE